MTDVRATQVVREIGANPTDTPVSATQVVREVAANPTDTPVRATSIVREVAANPTDTPVRVTSLVKEVLFRQPPAPTRWPDTVVSGGPMKASHISTIRDVIDDHYRAIYGHNYPWGWPNPVSQGHILAKYITDLRDVLQILWNFKGRGQLPDWTSGVTPGGLSVGTAATRILASDVNDLRSWLQLYEGNHPPRAQGIDTLCYDPDNSSLPTVDDAWAADVLNLAVQKPLFVRCNIKAPPDPEHPPSRKDLSDPECEPDLAKYAAALNRYEQRHLHVFALFTMEFYSPQGANPMAALDPITHTNAYISEFASRASTVSSYLKQNAQIDNFIIWNEPNIEYREGGVPNPAYLDAQHFAALLYHCWNAMAAVQGMYWGGVIFGPGWVDGEGHWHTDQNSLDYMSAVYNTLGPDGWGVAGGTIGSWPWSGTNIHVHHDREDEAVDNLFADVHAILDGNGDSNELLVGEWGIQVTWDPGGPTSLSHIYNKMKEEQQRVGLVFFHSHHGIDYTSPPDPPDPDELVPPDWPLPDWGIRYYTITQSAYGLAQKTPLYDPYNELMGT